jgi:hypothetical protein
MNGAAFVTGEGLRRAKEFRLKFVASRRRFVLRCEAIPGHGQLVVINL